MTPCNHLHRVTSRPHLEVRFSQRERESRNVAELYDGASRLSFHDGGTTITLGVTCRDSATRRATSVLSQLVLHF